MLFNFDKKISKSLDILSVLAHKNGGLSYLRTPAASLSSFTIQNRIKSYVPQLGTLIDVGANIGQFATATKVFYPSAHIVSFEPVPESFAALKVNTSTYSNINIYNLALGNSIGKLTFYKNEHSHASSALKVSSLQAEELPETKAYEEIAVDVTTLDAFEFPVALASPVLLKLDVQGYEKQVLEGGTTFLDQVDYLLFETSFEAMYDNEPLFDEMHQLVSQKGFQILAPVGMLESNGKILQLDMLYKKR